MLRVTPCSADELERHEGESVKMTDRAKNRNANAADDLSPALVIS